MAFSTLTRRAMRPAAGMVRAAPRAAAACGAVSMFQAPQRTMAPANTTVRNLNLHEYQSQALMRSKGINTPKGQVVKTVEEARRVAQELFDAGSTDVVVKAQVLAGGRGLGVFTNGFKGGVHLCFSVDDVAAKAEGMLNQALVTKQTGAEGAMCTTVLLTERVYSRRELYVAFVMNRAEQCVALVASTKGGVNIEQVAEEDPSAIVNVPISVKEGFDVARAEVVAKTLGFHANSAVAAEQLSAMYNFFISQDCTQLEINPFVETPDGQVLCLDAKVGFDSNAEFRHADIFAMHDASQDDPREIVAKKYDLNYIPLDGNVGCLVNGAGLAMATMDVIKLKGGEPANFLDVGGSATEDQVLEALKIMKEDQSVQCVLVNIFGGIMRCDVIASGLINAVEKLNLTKPLVVRLKGTNLEEALELLSKSSLKLITAEDLNEAAEKAVHIANIIDIAEEGNLKIKFE